MNDFDLSVFIEFGVGLAGFSGVVVAFGQRSGRLSDYDRFRVVQLLMSALAPAFLGLLPTVLAGFGVEGPGAWRVVGAALMAAIAANLGVALGSLRNMSAEARASLSPTVWRIAWTSSVFLLVWNGLNVAGWPGDVSPGPVLVGMVWLLVVASLMFFRLLLVRLGDGEERA